MKVNMYEDLPVSKENFPKQKKYSWASPSVMGVFKTINKNELNIDLTYQGSQISKKKVMEIARNWDWRLLGALSVIKRPDNTFWVYDGGHRARASIYREDIIGLPCMVFDAETIEIEAKAFVGRNLLKSAVGSYDKHKASIIAKEPTALAVEEILNKYGYIVARNTSVLYGISAIRSLTRLIQRDPQRTDAMLKLCTEIAENGEQLSHKIMTGMFYLVGKTNILSREWRKQLEKLGLKVLEKEMIRSGIINNKGGERIWAQGVESILNKQRRTKLKFYNR